MDAVELQCPNPISSDSSYSTKPSEQETLDNEGVLTMSNQLGCGPSSNSRVFGPWSPLLVWLVVKVFNPRAQW